MTAMNLILLAQHRLVAAVQRMAGLLWAPTQPAMAAPLASRRLPSVPYPQAVRRASAQTTRPLRVLRVMEPNQQRACVGRMVISGRMADVCAELDRLAAREAAMS